jgi:hypothetical protein
MSNDVTGPLAGSRPIYAFPAVGQGGLGDKLFPFARCAIASRRLGLKRIDPTWLSPHLGPWLRKERDKRFYAGLFRSGFGVGGLRKWALLALSQRIDEDDLPRLREFGRSPLPLVVVFNKVRNFFQDIAGDHREVLDLIMALANPRQTSHLASYVPGAIGVQVRLGDLKPLPASYKPGDRVGWVRLPLSWYVDVINRIRSCIGSEVPVHVFSDGSDEELTPILALKNVKRCYFGSALADLLALSGCKTLVGSASSFSMWAAYLGRMPAFWFPGFQFQKLYAPEEQFEGEVAGDRDLAPEARAALRKLF